MNSFMYIDKKKLKSLGIYSRRQRERDELATEQPLHIKTLNAVRVCSSAEW